MKKIAVIEDDESVVGALESLFHSRGAVTVSFPDPPSVEELARARPDLIILDCILETTSGPDFLKALREHPALQDIPVIVTTGYDEIYESLTVLESEHVAVLKKPLTAAALDNAARRIHAA